MSTPRCYVEPSSWGKQEIELTPSEAHHLLRVLRARKGEPVSIFDGQGKVGMARLKAGEPAVLEILGGPESGPERACRITLFQALPKGQRMDWIIEKATELGGAAVVPVMTERVVARLDGRQRKERAERWRRIAREAARQCGTCWIPAVEDIQEYGEALGRKAGAFDLLLVGSVGGDARALKEVLRETRDRPRTAGLVIGPEGDLTAAEVEEAVKAGGVGVSFGPQVLRVETAALAGLSILMHELA